MTEPKNDPRLTRLASGLPFAVPFVGPETQERARGRPFRARLGANECGFGPSPSAVAALAAAAPEAWMYGDPENRELRHALAARHRVPPKAVTVGEGIDGLLGSLVRLIVAPGEAVVSSAGAYPTFAYHVRGHGGALHTVPYAGDHEDPDALVAKAAETEAKLVYLSNPDNPMGTWHPAARIEEMLEALPPRALLVLDEAYADFAPPEAVPPLDPQDPRVIRMRTFSKAHGLAGMRVGYAIGPPHLTAAFDKVRNHFGVGRLAQAAALASLADPDHLAQTVARVAEAREDLAHVAAEHGLAALPSATNFVAIDCGAGGLFARAVLAELAARDVFVRMPGVAPLDRCIRVSAGPADEIAAFARALPEALDAAREHVFTRP